MGSMRVVELGIAEAHLDIGHAHPAGRAVDHRSILGANGHHVGIADGVAEKVGGRLLVIVGAALPAQGREGAVQFRGHRVQQDGRLLGGGGGGENGQSKGAGNGQGCSPAANSRQKGGEWVWKRAGNLG